MAKKKKPDYEKRLNIVTNVGFFLLLALLLVRML